MPQFKSEHKIVKKCNSETSYLKSDQKKKGNFTSSKNTKCVQTEEELLEPSVYIHSAECLSHTNRKQMRDKETNNLKLLADLSEAQKPRKMRPSHTNRKQMRDKETNNLKLLADLSEAQKPRKMRPKRKVKTPARYEKDYIIKNTKVIYHEDITTEKSSVLQSSKIPVKQKKMDGEVSVQETVTENIVNTRKVCLSFNLKLNFKDNKIRVKQKRESLKLNDKDSLTKPKINKPELVLPEHINKKHPAVPPENVSDVKIQTLQISSKRSSDLLDIKQNKDTKRAKCLQSNKQTKLTSAYIVQFQDKTFLVNTPVCHGEITPDKVVKELRSCMTRKSRDVKEVVIKEIKQAEKPSMSGIEAILKASELISTDRTPAESGHEGECFITYPVNSAKSVSYKTVRMSSLDSQFISTTLNKFHQSRSQNNEVNTAECRYDLPSARPKITASESISMKHETTDINISSKSELNNSSDSSVKKNTPPESQVCSNQQEKSPMQVPDPQNWKQFAVAKYLCEKCGKEFCSGKKLNSHITNAHKMKQVQLYRCTMCDQHFSTSPQLKHHKLLAHKISQELLKPSREQVPEERTTLPYVKLNVTKPVKTERCSICKVMFRSSIDLEDHMISCHSNKVVFSDLIVCEPCDEAFMLVRDYLVHKQDVHNCHPNLSRIGPGRTKSARQEIQTDVNRENRSQITESNEKKNCVIRKLVNNGLSKAELGKDFTKTFQFADTTETDIITKLNCDKTCLESSVVSKTNMNIPEGQCSYSSQVPESGEEQRVQNEDDVKLFYCDVCYKHVRNLHTHILMHTGEKPFKCTKCRAAFSSSVCLKIHLKLHYKQYIICVCHKCGKKLKQEADFDSHVSNCHQTIKLDRNHNGKRTSLNSNENSLSCDAMGESTDMCVSKKRAEIVDVSADHSYGSTNQSLDCSFYRCKICGKVGSNLRAHMLAHASEATHRCLKCKKSFNSDRAFKSHMMSHNSSSLHQCNYCDKKYLYKQSLQRHLVQHTGVFPHKCFVCQKGFIYPKDLYSHISTHAGYESWKPDVVDKYDNSNISKIICGTELVELADGLYRCPKCSLNFSDVRTLSKHLIYKCNICGKVSKKSRSIFEHMKIHSDGPYICSMCSLTFQTYLDMKSHRKSHFRGVHKCPHCLKCYPFKSRLSKHLLSHSEVRLFHCDICQRSYRYKGDLVKHQVVHHAKDKPFKCDLCKKSFHTRSLLKSHEQWVHQPENDHSKMFVCDTCGKQCPNFSILKVHVRTHSLEKPFVCEICEKQFRTKTNMYQHMKVHSDKRPYKCLLCGKDYKSSNALNLHHQTHTGVKPFSCKICGKKFLEKNKLKIHMRSHTGEKEFKCSVCDKRFAYKSLLTNHEVVHTGERKYTCKVCNRSFTQQANLRVHCRIHTGELPYSCKMCSKRFRTSNRLADHVRTHTGEHPFSCDVCPQVFMFKKQLHSHIRSHGNKSPYKCAKCRKIFTLEANLDNHYEIHLKEEQIARNVLKAEQQDNTHFKTQFEPSVVNDDTIHCSDFPYSCNICEYRFETVSELKSHKTSHLMKPFQCAVCSETFCSPELLSAHLVNHVDIDNCFDTHDSQNFQLCDVSASSDVQNFSNSDSVHCPGYDQEEIVQFEINDDSGGVSSVTQQTTVNESAPVVVLEYRDTGTLADTNYTNEGITSVEKTEEPVIIEQCLEPTDQCPYITIQVPSDYNQNITELISQASDYLDILTQSEVTI